jgi:hypothetical protein
MDEGGTVIMGIPREIKISADPEEEVAALLPCCIIRRFSRS